jgi:hypothetical protein
MWSLLDYFPEDFKINILDIGAALNERPPYQSLVDAGRAKSSASSRTARNAND